MKRKKLEEKEGEVDNLKEREQGRDLEVKVNRNKNK